MVLTTRFSNVIIKLCILLIAASILYVAGINLMTMFHINGFYIEMRSKDNFENYQSKLASEYIKFKQKHKWRAVKFWKKPRIFNIHNMVTKSSNVSSLLKLTEINFRQILNITQCKDRIFNTEYLQRGVFWVLKNYVRAHHGNIMCHKTMTFTTHSSFEFLENIRAIVERWMGPISVAIHAPGPDFQSAVNSIRYLRDCLGHNLIKLYVTFHIFFSYKHMPDKIIDPETFLSTEYNCTEDPPYNVKNSSYAHKKRLLYPVNVARNIAREAALTHFILAADIELYPSPFLIQQFLDMIARNSVSLSNFTSPRVFPIAIFEVEANANVPSSKTELQAMLANQSAVPFHKYVCPSCHDLPYARQWIDAPETYQMDILHVSKRRGLLAWEPTYIGTHQDNYFDERLSWEGTEDKIVQGYILCVKDYDFMILNNAFLVHKPGIKRVKTDPERLKISIRQLKFIKNHVLPDIAKLYGTKSGCIRHYNISL